MTKDETALLKIAIHAGQFSEHFALLEAQREKGWSPHFSEIWRNAIGNFHANAHRAWERWSTHAADANENLFKPNQA